MDASNPSDEDIMGLAEFKCGEVCAQLDEIMWICVTARYIGNMHNSDNNNFVHNRSPGPGGGGGGAVSGSNSNVASSSEDLANRLRPGVSSSTKVTPTRANFQEELMRLINPDISLAELEHALNKVRAIYTKRKAATTLAIQLLLKSTETHSGVTLCFRCFQFDVDSYCKQNF